MNLPLSWDTSQGYSLGVKRTSYKKQLECFSSCCRRYNMAQNTTGLSYTNPVASFIGNWSTIHLSPCQRGGVCGSPGTAIVAEFNLVCKDSWNLDLFQLYVNTRFFIGSMSIGYIADRFDCKFRMLITVLVRSVSGILMAFALSYMWMVISHLVQGLVSKGGWLTDYIPS
nr:solute carrier family 22 member 2-like [Dromaius novaehollandiae]